MYKFFHGLSSRSSNFILCTNRTVKCIEGGVSPATMAKRLLKALRGKRRWLGFQCSTDYTSRQSIGQKLKLIFEGDVHCDEIRVMDFYPAGCDDAKTVSEALDITPTSFGFGILQIPHPATEVVRSEIGRDDSMQVHGIQSLTMSGKIRLVRERLSLPKPQRKR